MGVKELVAGRGLARHARVAALQATRSPTTTAPRRRGCARRARCSSGSRRHPSSARSNWTRSYLHGVTRNPWNPERTPGGSSGGSAAAVAVGHDADLHRAATAAARSASRPSYSGLFGFKVSFGRVGDSGRVRQRAHVGARPDVPLGARRGALRRRDRRTDRRRSRPRCRSRRARTRTRCCRVTRSQRCAASAWRGRRRSASRCAIPRSRSSPTKPRSRSSTDAGLELVDVDVHIPKPGACVGHPVDRRRVAPPRRSGARPAATTSRRSRATASR